MLITRFEIQGRGRREGRARWESAGERACRAVPKRLRGRRKEAMLWRTLRRARGFCKITRARSDGGAKSRVCNSLVVHWATAILEQLTKGQQEIVVAPATDPSRATAMIKPRSCKCFLAKKSNKWLALVQPELAQPSTPRGPARLREPLTSLLKPCMASVDLPNKEVSNNIFNNCAATTNQTTTKACFPSSTTDTLTTAAESLSTSKHCANSAHLSQLLTPATTTQSPTDPSPERPKTIA